MKCPHCGYDKIQPNFNFCPKCTKPLKDHNQSTFVENTESRSQEKGFINRLVSGWTYEKAKADPYGYASWAYRNPNDHKKFFDSWKKANYDVEMIENAIIEANRARYENPTADRVEVDANIIDSNQQQSRRESRDQFVRTVNRTYPTDAAALVRNKAIWKLQANELARHIAPDEWCYVSEHLEGIVIEEGTSAIIYVDGQEVAQMGSGMYVFDDKHAAAAEIEAELRRREHQSNGSFLSRLVSGIYRFFTGHKRDEGSMQREERRRRVQQIINRMKKDTVIDVYLKSDRVFPTIFGSQYLSDSPEGYSPYTIQSRYLDLKVGVSMQMQISDFKEFIANYFPGRKSVTIQDVVKSVDGAVFSTLRFRLRDIEVSERGLDEVTFRAIAGILKSNLPNLLHGITVVEVLDIATSSTQLDRFREVESQLYCTEQEYDFLLRTNEFRNRIASEENDQKIREARSEQELRVRLDEINKDNLIHDDEMKQFVSLLMNQKVIREATNKVDLDKAMFEIERNRLISQEEFDIFTNDLENRQLDREQVSEQLRARSLTVTVLKRMELSKAIDLREIDDDKTIALAGIRAKDEVSDAEWAAYRKERARDAEDWDMEAVIYGRKYVLDKQKLIDEVEKRRLHNEAEAETIRGTQQQAAAQRTDILENHKLYGTIEDDNYQREIRKREDDLKHLRDKIALSQSVEDHKAARALENLRKIKEMELNELKEKHTLSMNAVQEQHAHELNIMREKNDLERSIANINADVEKTRITTEGNMSADQLMGKNIGIMDAEAQIKFAESFSHLKEFELNKINANEREALYQQMLQMAQANNLDMINVQNANSERQMEILRSVLGAFTQMNMAQSGGQQNTVNSMLGAMQNFANTRFNDAKEMKEEYRTQMQHEQGRTDETQRQAMNYTTHVKVSENTPNIVRGGTSINVHVNTRICPTCGQLIEENDSLCCFNCGQNL